ncbi:MAG: LysR family transcriptional regulator [Bacillota bacterium]
MLDNRIHTFLKLCEVGNYRITAEMLNMTQPAVTQHIHFLEQQYGCKLFEYKDRKLFKTPECLELEKHALAIVYNDEFFKGEISKPKVKKIAIGATKTIGEYVIFDKVQKLLLRDDVKLELAVDNTKRLMERLHALELDILMVEGYFDKNEYTSVLIKKEDIVGICGKTHPFAGKSVDISEIFQWHLILREKGSGTRSVFESFLKQNNFSTESFEKISEISSMSVIEKAVEGGNGISFVYQSVPKSNKKLATFKIKNAKITHEFNYVFLKNANVKWVIDAIESEI